MKPKPTFYINSDGENKARCARCNAWTTWVTYLKKVGWVCRGCKTNADAD